MTSTIIIPNDAMVSVPIPPAYIGREVEVTFSLVNGAAKTAFREQQILEPDDDLRRAITFDELLERTYEDIHQMFNNK
ncbi:MAG: hypothetical protein FWD09_03390 [Lentimicrobiaceae bacterium]|nr:hypothetical protein [Lentimicrobiaceae bacterium]